MKNIQRLNGLLAAVDGARFKARLVQDDGKSIGNDLFIIGYENPGLRRCCDLRFRHAENPQNECSEKSVRVLVLIGPTTDSGVLSNDTLSGEKDARLLQ